MYTRAEVERQLKTRKTWTGKEVARILLSNFYSGTITGKNIISDDEITYIQTHPRNDKENLKIYSYSKLYTSLMDIYNIIESYAAQALSSIALLNNSLTAHFRMLQFRQHQLHSPLMITKDQEKKYLENYKKYINKRIQLDFTKTETWISFLLRRDSIFINNIDINGFKDIHSHSEKTTHIINEYKITKVKNIDFAKRLSKRLFPKGIVNPDMVLSRYQRVFGPAPQEYVDAIAKQYRYKTKPLYRYGQKVLKETYKLLYYHQKRFSFEEALKRGIAKFPVNFPEGEPQPMPDDISKYDFLTKVIIPGYIKKGLWNWRTDELNSFLMEEYGDYLNASKQDVISEYPKLKTLFKDTHQPLDTLGNWGMFYNAGIQGYNPKPSKNSYEYGRWRGFPAEVRSRVREYGYAVYHDAGTINNFAQFKENNDFILQDLAQTKTNKDKRHRKQAYDQIEQYLAIYQCYVTLVRGIKTWTGIKDVNKLIHVSNGYSRLLRESREYNQLIYSEYAGLRDIMKEDVKERQKAVSFLDNYMPLDIEKKRIPHSTNEALKEYLNRIFKPGHPQNATMLINDIAEGLRTGGDD